LEKNYKQTYQGYDPNSPESNIMFEFIQDKNMENSVELAKYMQKYVCQATGRQNMGAQQDNLAVLRLSSMPGCLVECGFISTSDEETFMNSQAAAEKYARGFFNAFQAYRRNHGGGASISVQPQVANEAIAEKNSKAERKRAKEEKKAREKKLKEEKKAAAESVLTLAPVPAVPEPQREAMTEPQLEVKPEPLQEVKPEPQPEVKLEMTPEAKPEPKPADKLEVKPEAKPEVKPEPKPVPQPSAPKPQPQGPVFKVQIFASSALIKAGDARFKGLSGTGYYKDGGLYKYTVGDSTDYNAINRLRRKISDKFPQAFVVAFKDGVRMDVNEAIREFKKVKK
jgi:N-acetylmuramoyl-L-alanine amidase